MKEYLLSLDIKMEIDIHEGDLSKNFLNEFDIVIITEFYD